MGSNQRLFVDGTNGTALGVTVRQMVVCEVQTRSWDIADSSLMKQDGRARVSSLSGGKAMLHEVGGSACRCVTLSVVNLCGGGLSSGAGSLPEVIWVLNAFETNRRHATGSH